MKGAIAVPWLNTIKTPNNARTIKIGKSQYFFLTFKNSKNSFINAIITMYYNTLKSLSMKFLTKKHEKNYYF